MVPADAQKIIDKFAMTRIPHEGPWFAPTYKSPELIGGVAADRYSTGRYVYSAILAVFTREDFSAMHKLATDEMWHFYGGCPTDILLLYPDGTGEIKRLGNNVADDENPQVLVPAGTWMGASPVGPDKEAYTFAGNTLSPGFEYDDYIPGDRDVLVSDYPGYARLIRSLTRI